MSKLGDFLYETLTNEASSNKQRDLCWAVGSEIEALKDRLVKLEKPAAKKPAAKK